MTVSALVSVCGEALEIFTGFARMDEESEGRGVGRNDEVIGESAFQPETGHPKSAVLIGALRVGEVIAGLGDTPGHAAVASVLDLPLDDGTIGLVEESVLVRGHEEQRHEILEHRSAPGEQGHRAALCGELATEGEPVILFKISAGYEHVTGEPGLGREEIVEGGVEAAVADIVADREEVPRGVVEEGEIHLRLLRAAPGEVVDQGDAVGGIFSDTWKRGELAERRQRISSAVSAEEKLEVVECGAGLTPECRDPPVLLGIAIALQRFGIEGKGQEPGECVVGVRGRERGVGQLFTEKLGGGRRDEPEGVAETVGDGGGEHELIRQLQQSGAQGGECPREVAAVHAGNVKRQERL